MKSDEFIREVDEELQREKLAQLWKRHGTLVVAAAVGVVLATAGWVGWQRWQEHRRIAEAERFAQSERAALGGGAEAAAGLLSFARDARPGFAALARLQAAAVAGRAGDEAVAAAALDAVAGDGRADPLLREAALLAAVSRRADTDDPAELARRLEPLAADGGPWRHAARQLLAAVQLRSGQREQAVATLRRLADDAEAPAGSRARAAELLDALGASAGRPTS